ncbi:family 43 glycosylhydrolase [Bdellovibrio sp. SKB1291214]|uniref:family 43 glycosylhydrolase n=1 Tax=Bdellovibrio sp. SKB1291214 TaxID=1732569 RepID=UPI000B516545|nr:family 43 glycosylhydrolase [Bdellovibrio sp. SKB1291214]UYL07280.1 family 43 glycosylhydrolase [Bdellovibrio sp. SKB1291214]
MRSVWAVTAILLSFLSVSKSAYGKKNDSVLLDLKINGATVLDSPDPSVFKKDDRFYLSYTTDSGNIPVFVSNDLKNWKFQRHVFASSDIKMVGNALKFGEYYYCHIWAPEFHHDSTGKTYLTFTAVRTKEAPPQGRCPDYNQDSGIYISVSDNGMNGHFGEPQSLKADKSCMSTALTPRPGRSPASPDTAFNSCQGGDCDAILRLDSTVFSDQGKNWLAYSWYANSIPNAWEEKNYGEHLSIVQMDTQNLGALSCDSETKKIFAVNPHDSNLYTGLAKSCKGCDKNLSFTTGRSGKPFLMNGYLQGVAEGASIFRNGNWVYLLASGGIWDSKSYHVFWIAAPSVEELSLNNPKRVVGRYLIPDDRYSYGHGSVVEKEQGQFFYVYHRLDHQACSKRNDCRRRIMISPIEFQVKNDGQNAVHIKPRI